MDVSTPRIVIERDKRVKEVYPSLPFQTMEAVCPSPLRWANIAFMAHRSSLGMVLFKWDLGRSSSSL